MRAMFLKELKEHYKWSIIGFVGCLVLLFNNFNPKFDNQIYSILDNDIVNSVTFLFTIIGFAFGILQTVFDRQKNQWIYLLHRPIESKKIFYSKILSGLVLYFAATLLPYLIFVVYARRPEIAHTPFTYHQLAPALIDWVNGMLCYLAGMILILRNARWYISRPLVMGGAAISIFVAQHVSDASIALIVAIVFGIFLFASAKDCFNSLEKQIKKTPLSHFSISLNVFTGFQWLLILLGILYSFLNREPPKYNRSWEETFYAIEKDTENPVKVIVKKGNDVGWYKGIYKSISNVDEKTELSESLKGEIGKAVDSQNDKEKLFLSKNNFYYGRDNYKLPFYGYRNYDHYFYSIPEYYEDDRGFRKIKRTKNTYWYFSNKDKLIYGYKKNKTPDGLACHLIKVVKKETSQKNTEFFRSKKSLFKNNLIVFGDGIYTIDFKKHDLISMFKNENDEKILSIGYIVNELEDRHIENYDFSVLTNNNFYVLKMDGEIVWKMPLKNLHLKDLKKYKDIKISRGKSNYYLFCTLEYGERHLEVFSEQGDLLKYEPLSKLDIKQSIKKSLYYPSGFLVSPILILFMFLYLKSWNSYTLVIWMKNLHDDEILIFKMLVFIASIVCFFITLFHAKRNSLSLKEQIGWSAFSLLFGLAGLLSYLCMYSWPKKKNCPSCKKLRVINKENCSHCGNTFENPPLDGTEVFA